jgi:succinate dehydrogenase hydrophobic anchor subunit
MQTNRKSINIGENSWVWLVKIIAGILILFFLGLHFVVNHLVVPGGLLSYADVVAYYQNPIIPIIEIGFLVVVIAHCLLGLRGIVLDLNPSKNLLQVLDVIMALLAIFAIGYGIWLVLVIVARGTPV